MPYPASLIAYAFVKKGIEAGKPVTQMKLQKMVYFAHGYHMAKGYGPLIDEDFEAWQFGPVVPVIYSEYKRAGRDPIRTTDEQNDAKLRELSPQAWESINYTWEATKNLSAMTLSNWTHKKGSPWDVAYMPNYWSVPMDNSVIESYFREFFEKLGQQQISN